MNLSEKEQHRKQLEESFDKAISCRKQYCTPDGKIYKHFAYFKEQYEALLNNVMRDMIIVLTDNTLHTFYIPYTNEGCALINTIRDLLEEYIPGLTLIVKKGTWKDFLLFEDSFYERASALFIEFCINNINKREASNGCR